MDVDCSLHNHSHYSCYPEGISQDHLPLILVCYQDKCDERLAIFQKDLCNTTGAQMALVMLSHLPASSRQQA